MFEDHLQTIGARAYARRVALGLDLGSVAEAVGIAHDLLRDFEAGSVSASQQINSRAVLRLAHVLEISASCLLRI